MFLVTICLYCITLKEKDNFIPTRSSSARRGQLLSWALNTCHDKLIYLIGMALSENHFSANSTWTQPPHPRSRSGSQSWSRPRYRRQSVRVFNLKNDNQCNSFGAPQLWLKWQSWSWSRSGTPLGTCSSMPMKRRKERNLIAFYFWDVGCTHISYI